MNGSDQKKVCHNCPYNVDVRLQLLERGQKGIGKRMTLLDNDVSELTTTVATISGHFAELQPIVRQVLNVTMIAFLATLIANAIQFGSQFIGK